MNPTNSLSLCATLLFVYYNNITWVMPDPKSLPIVLEKHQLDKLSVFRKPDTSGEGLLIGKRFINVAKSHPFLVPCVCGIGKGPGDGSEWIGQNE
jgi:hypothetical protein